MKRIRFGLLTAGMFFWSLSVAVMIPDQTVATDGTVRVGDMAPDFTVESFDGEPIRLSDRLGDTPVLVFFWSYFCFPCQKELPAIQSFVRELTDDRFAVIGLCLDGQEYDDRIRPFVKENGITFPNAYDRYTDDFFEIAEKYGVVGTPTSFLLDAQGKVRSIHLGRLDPQVLKSLVKSAREQAFCAEIIKPERPPATPAE